VLEHICNSAPVIRSSLVFPSSDADKTVRYSSCLAEGVVRKLDGH
jgi:hypothetical protein